MAKKKINAWVNRKKFMKNLGEGSQKEGLLTMEEEAALAHATRITETMQTEGWSLIRRILRNK